MYCVVESPKVLNPPVADVSHIKLIKANRDNMFLCVISSSDIMIWLTTVRFSNQFFTNFNPIYFKIKYSISQACWSRSISGQTILFKYMATICWWNGRMIPPR